MTPAEKPSATDKNLVFVRDVNNESRLPIPVARPANNVSNKANATFPSIDPTSFYLSIFIYYTQNVSFAQLFSTSENIIFLFLRILQIYY